MIFYPDGTKAQIGDNVTLAHGAHSGIVFSVMESEVDLEEWGVGSPGLMIDTSFGGLVFYPKDSLVGDEITFVSRQALAG